MPVGPSHGGGSHSHSSGGGYSSSSSSHSHSSGGGYSSSSSSGSRYSTSSHSTYYVGGGGGYYSYHMPMSSKSKKKLWLIVGIIIFTLTAIIGSVLFFKNIGSTLLMRKDAKEYTEIIERANNNEEGYFTISINNILASGYSISGDSITYSLSGDHNSHFEAIYEVKRNGVYYFYLTYTFIDDYGRNLSGESYTSYSESAVKGLSSMTFAYTLEYDKDGSWDIIDINYSLKTNMDYWKTRSTMLKGLFLFLFFAALDVFFIYMLVRVCKDIKIFTKDIFKKSKKVTTSQNTQTENYERMICEFCGTIIGKTDKKCPSCGGTKFVVTKIKKNFKN